MIRKKHIKTIENHTKLAKANPLVYVADVRYEFTSRLLKEVPTGLILRSVDMKAEGNSRVWGRNALKLWLSIHILYTISENSH